MSLTRKLSAAFLTAVIALHSSINVYAEEENNFTYTIINGEATIIGYTGEPVYIEIPEKLEECPVTQIRDNAFFNCSSLRQISLPSTIRKIGHHTFYACSSLESVVLPSELEEIGMGAFSGCGNLSVVNIPTALTVLPESCFQSCTSLTETFIPSGIELIGDLCFSGCTSLSYVSIGNGTNAIGGQAFYMCSSLENLYIPPSVTEIGYEAAGFSPAGNRSELQSGFTILGEPESAAEKYAAQNGIVFSAASEAVQVSSLNPGRVKRVPLWILLLLTGGGIGFFALSCVIAVRQRHYEKKKTSQKPQNLQS